MPPRVVGLLAAGALGVLAVFTTTPPVVDAACRGTLVRRSSGVVRSNQLVEVSGVVESSRRPGVLWLHNDSGDSARLYAVGLDGRELAVFALDGIEAIDWEDIALGPGEGSGRRTLYVGDIGDNERQRDTVAVVRLREPVVDPAGRTGVQAVAGADVLTLRYPDGAHDAEALLVDPRTGELLLVTKDASGVAGVYRAPAGLPAGSTTTLTRVRTLRLGLGAAVTGGDVSAGGEAVVLRTYSSVLLYRRAPGRSLATAFAEAPCRGLSAAEPQGEAVGFRASGRGYVTVSEGEHPRVYRFELR